MVKYLLSILIIIFSCSQNNTDTPNDGDSTNSQIIDEVNSIHSSDELRLYLEMIEKLDQEKRSQIPAIESEFGSDSPEKNALWDEIIKTDNDNLIRVEEIFKKFGYPKVDSVGIVAASQPLMVIHHSQEISTRKKHIALIYQAYINEDIQDNLMGLFIDRMYRMKFNKRFDIEGSFKMKSRIDSMLLLMDIDIDQGN